MFKYYNKKKRMKHTAHEIYGSIVAQARMPVFYADWRVPDTVEGRFEMLVLHMALVICRLNHGMQDGPRQLGRLVAEAFIDDLDDSFREMGVGDLAVPKRIKKASEAYLGRLRAYGAALDNASLETLANALTRNIAANDEIGPVGTQALADYMLRSSRALNNLAFDQMCCGPIEFADFHLAGNDSQSTREDSDDRS